MRWILGDVHGCARQLDDLLRHIRFDPGRDELFSVGDLINRGPDSLAVLRTWRDLDGQGVLGNHDVSALLSRSGIRPRSMPTLDDLFCSNDGDELLAYLRAMPALCFLPSAGEGPDAWVVHAGLHPDWQDPRVALPYLAPADHSDGWLQSPPVRFATTVRCCDADGSRVKHAGPAQDCPAGSQPWDAHYRGETLVVHGHWAMRGHYRNRFVMGLDSGCVYGGKLTAWCQDEDRIAQVSGWTS